MLTGGAIGFAIPAAIGAAVACPDRKVVSLNWRRAAMYTVQGLWTIAREGLDVLTIVFANHAYRILNIEMGAPARAIPVRRRVPCWTSAALGSTGSRSRAAWASPPFAATDVASLDRAVARAMAERGPAFIEVALGQ
jgi:acetolactate synthase-1/2/3 large subunit